MNIIKAREHDYSEELFKKYIHYYETVHCFSYKKNYTD